MPKNRKQTKRKGAKSIAIRTKHKIGGRKSSKGTGQMKDTELLDAAKRARPRDRQKLKIEWDRRGVRTEHLQAYWTLG